MGRVCHGEPCAGGGSLHQPARVRVTGQDRACQALCASAFVLGHVPTNRAVTGAHVLHAQKVLRAGAGLPKQGRAPPSNGVRAAGWLRRQLGMLAGGKCGEGRARAVECDAGCMAGVLCGLTGLGHQSRLCLPRPSRAGDIMVAACSCRHEQTGGLKGATACRARATRARLWRLLLMCIAAVNRPGVRQAGPPIWTGQRQSAARGRADKLGGRASSSSRCLVPDSGVYGLVLGGCGATRDPYGARQACGG